MTEILPLLLGTVDTAAQAMGLPVAAGIAREITQSCEDVARHKRHARMVGVKSNRLIQALEEAQEEGPGLEGTKVQERIDEVVAVLEKTRKRVNKWVRMSVVVRWWKRTEIQTEIEQSNQELDTALQIFTLKIQISQEQSQRLARAEALHNDYENKELLRQILANQKNLALVAHLHQAGESIARDVMEEGQQVLRNMRSTQRQGLFPWNSNGKRYLDVQRGLMNLHDMTGIPPSIKILDGEIKRKGELAVAGGTSSDIWLGTWLGQKRVALKAIRAVRADDTKAQRHFVREINIWSELENEHILQLYGIVSPWLENGNVLTYIVKNPEAERLPLLRGAAKGLSYLHSQGIIHGNVKCSNILVSDHGEACISDFGMAKALEDVTKTAATTTLQSMGCARWMAPEIVEGGSPSKASDTYSFAMAILELLTEKHPLAEHKTDIAIIRAMTRSASFLPKRPTGAGVNQWLTDELWSLMERCWGSSERRPTMEDACKELQAM